MPTDPSQADPSIVALMHGIKTAEGTKGDYTSIGDQGTAAGIGQWSNQINGVPQKLQKGQIPSNFQAWATQYNLNPNDFSPENQNKVLYARLADRKKAGLTPEQILSEWNSGSPDKYLSSQAKGVGAVGNYDVADYVKRGMTAAQEYAQKQKQPNATQQQSTGIPKVQLQIPPGLDTSSAGPQQETVGSDLEKGNYGGAAMKAGKGLLDFAFPIIGDVVDDFKGQSQKNALQQGADAALSILPFIPFIGEAGTAIRGAGLAGDLALGATAGGLQGVSQGQDLSGIVGSAGLGAVTGGLLHGAGNLVGKLTQALPTSLIRKYVPGLSADEAQYAATRPLGTPSQMLTDSNSNLTKIGTGISAALKKPQYTYIQPSGEQIVDSIINSPQLADAGLTPKTLAQNLSKILPLKKNLINKLVSGQDMTLTELHQLNSSLGKATFKRVFDDPIVRAGKDIGNVTYHTISDVLKTAAPETKQMFDDYSKEIALNAGLQKLSRSIDKSKPIGLKEILGIMSLFTGGGVLPTAIAYGTEKAAASPTVNLKTAGLLTNLGKVLGSKTVQGSGKAAIPTLSRGLVGGVSNAGSIIQQ